MKTKHISGKVTVFVTADSKSIFSYFNPHDPSPVYSRQLSQDFEEYLNNCISRANRYSVINYKVVCMSKIDALFTGPLMEAIRKHYRGKKVLKEKEFGKFKKRSYYLLGIGFVIVMICQGLLPYILNHEHRIHSAFSNALDVFSWVVLWKPIERLIFYWNPFLKEISLLDKMIHAEAAVVENEQSNAVYSISKGKQVV
jgi:hypothetical protein